MASGYVPVLKSVATHPVYASFLENADGGDNIAALSAKVCVEQQESYFTSPAFNGSSTARDQVGFLMIQAMSEDIPAGQTLDQFIENKFAAAIQECEYSL
jgi:hypothetical protein